MRVRAALVAVAMVATVGACGGSSATSSPSAAPPASSAPASAAPSLAPAEVTPAPEVSPAPVTGTTYVVKKGDTLYAIAIRFKITLKALQAANPSITDPRMLKVGQKLVIPAP